MEKLAYYNEFDPQVAAWLRVLIAEGHIAPGVVDERSIEDVRPSDLRGFAQCHFFAGIGVWSYALRRAGWRDDRPIWTGSCPCQPFSAAGKGAGFDDERHLWPAFQWLIQEYAPECVVGEQVASAAVDDWIDLVHADMEALGYAFGSVPFPAAGVGAPHIRDRNYWVAHTNGARRSARGKGCEALGHGATVEPDCSASRLAYAGSTRPQEQWGGWQQPARLAEVGIPGGMGNASGQGLDERKRKRGILGGTCGTVKGEASFGTGIHVAARTCPTNGYWADADWLGCRDGKFRPVEPGTFPLVTGASARVVRSSDPSEPINFPTGEARVMRLRGYGNAINSEAAIAFIKTVAEVIDGV